VSHVIHPVVIIGSGAAGMMAAIFAGNAGVPVLLLESRRVPGAKIRVSGGGRCNILPSIMTLADYHTSGSLNAMRNVLMSWPLEEVKRFFSSDLGIPMKVESTGKMFPVSDRSKDVVDALLAGLSRAHVTLRGEARVIDLVRDGDIFAITLESGETLRATRVVLSGGGLSMPRTGSDGGTWAMAKKLGHTVLPTYAALVPLLTDDRRWHDLAGLSLNVELDVRASGGKSLAKRREDFLFTHTGFSGPSTLDVSRHFTQPVPAEVLAASWAPGVDWERLFTTPQKRAVVTLVREYLPRRLADTLFERCGVPLERMASDLSREERKRLLTELTSCPLAVTGSEGYRTAEVTAGGIPLEELSLKTLESRVVPGLFICGEMLDVKGRIGGFNFLWAWVTGRRVGLTLAATSVLSPSAA